ncbi:hypothetical protein HanPI659440_Chr04g0176991 [Helianthus annuus]|nr:hypothetical protein HanPI659440_Chr04g0176991 [Helianthus annuus]
MDSQFFKPRPQIMKNKSPKGFSLNITLTTARHQHSLATDDLGRTSSIWKCRSIDKAKRIETSGFCDPL